MNVNLITIIVILNFAAKSALSKQDAKQIIKKDAKILSLLLSSKNI